MKKISVALFTEINVRNRARFLRIPATVFFIKVANLRKFSYTKILSGQPLASHTHVDGIC